MRKMTGQETFELDSKQTELTVLDFWRFQYSNKYFLQDAMAEYLVASALGVKESNNSDYWALYDVDYKVGDKNYRIEVKETSYYHPWNEDGKVSKQRTFGITKANSNYENEKVENKYERQNDIYVFCLVKGENKEDANPLNLNNWEFYVIRTEVINEICGDNKTISLGRVQKLATKRARYNELKEEIDREISEINDR